MRLMRVARTWVSVALAITAMLALAGCSSAIPNRNPTGETFPATEGQSLREEKVRLPGELAGEPALLLIGYEQDAQFDIDRWLIGLAMTETDIRVLEVPTIPGFMATMASGFIDDGMRGGIPEEDWGIVVTLYGSAARPVAEFTGTTNGQVARVLVLDARGQVIWFDDKGFNTTKVLALSEFVSRL